MEYIPFTPSDTNYRLAVALPEDGSTQEYLFDVRWNARDSVDPITGAAKGAHYFDLLEQDETPILLGIKVVAGAWIGRSYRHLDFFQKHILQVIDTTGQGRDPAYDELGSRVQVVHFTLDEFRGAT